MTRPRPVPKGHVNIEWIIAEAGKRGKELKSSLVRTHFARGHIKGRRLREGSENIRATWVAEEAEARRYLNERILAYNYPGAIERIKELTGLGVTESAVRGFADRQGFQLGGGAKRLFTEAQVQLAAQAARRYHELRKAYVTPGEFRMAIGVNKTALHRAMDMGEVPAVEVDMVDYLITGKSPTASLYFYSRQMIETADVRAMWKRKIMKAAAEWSRMKRRGEDPTLPRELGRRLAERKETQAALSRRGSVKRGERQNTARQHKTDLAQESPAKRREK